MSESDEETEYAEFAIRMAVNSFEAVRNEESQDAVIRRIQDHPDYGSWIQKQISTLCLAYPEDSEDAAEAFEELFRGFSWRFEAFFSDDDAFHEIQNELVERESQGFQRAHENIQRVLDGEDPMNVYDDTVEAIRVQTIFEDSK